MPGKQQYATIYEAIKFDDVSEVQSHIQKGVGLNDKDKKFKLSPLHWAALHGCLESLHWLLWHNADYSEKSPEGWTPVHLASIKGQDAVVQALAANGADLNDKDMKGRSPAHLAASHGNSYTLQSILRKGVDINAVDNHGWTAAHAAAFHGRLGCLQMLHRWGIKLNETDKAGNTPVHLAASEGHLHCLKFLLCSCGNIEEALNARNDQGETPKDLALQFYKQDCVDYMKAVEYDVNHPETAENLAFPAHVAAFKGDLPYLRMLVETGVVSVNERDDKGSTPCHKAAGNGQVEVLKWLLDEGANTTITNSAGETARDVARRFGKLACIKLLGGDSDVEDCGEEEIRPESVADKPKAKTEARGRALKKVDELVHLLDIAKMNYRQLGGTFEEDEKIREEDKENARIIRELEAQLEYEREKREKLESQLDQLRGQVHSLDLQLEEARNRSPEHSEPVTTARSTTSKTSVRKKKKLKARPSSGVFVLRGVSSSHSGKS